MQNNLVLKFNTKESLIHYRQKLTGTIGFVPTMGNLHQGHLELVKNSLSNNDTTIVSIFVNPKQFAPNEDFANYPRTLLEDCQKLESLGSKNIVLFFPENEKEVFENNDNDNWITQVITPLFYQLEGEIRPHFFEGVCKVVKKLFEIIEPHNAYFGKKDYQQLRIIEHMVKILQFPITIHGLETQRNSQFLALSSRNQYLNSQEISLATQLPHVLMKLRNTILQLPHFEILELNNLVDKTKKELLDKLAQSNFLKENTYFWNYLEIRESYSLKKLQEINLKIKPLSLTLLANFQLAGVRLLDNLEIHIGSSL
jgi:pantoate--beta-alanine ligase